jgi:hypothetical protein
MARTVFTPGVRLVGNLDAEVFEAILPIHDLMREGTKFQQDYHDS